MHCILCSRCMGQGIQNTHRPPPGRSVVVFLFVGAARLWRGRERQSAGRFSGKRRRTGSKQGGSVDANRAYCRPCRLSSCFCYSLISATVESLKVPTVNCEACSLGRARFLLWVLHILGVMSDGCWQPLKTKVRIERLCKIIITKLRIGGFHLFAQ